MSKRLIDRESISHEAVDELILNFMKLQQTNQTVEREAEKVLFRDLYLAGLLVIAVIGLMSGFSGIETRQIDQGIVIGLLLSTGIVSGGLFISQLIHRLAASQIQWEQFNQNDPIVKLRWAKEDRIAVLDAIIETSYELGLITVSDDVELTLAQKESLVAEVAEYIETVTDQNIFETKPKRSKAKSSIKSGASQLSDDSDLSSYTNEIKQEDKKR